MGGAVSQLPPSLRREARASEEQGRLKTLGVLADEPNQTSVVEAGQGPRDIKLLE